MVEVCIPISILLVISFLYPDDMGDRKITNCDEYIASRLINLDDQRP